MPVSISGSTSNATVEYDYLGLQAIPTPATPRRRKDRRPLAVQREMQRAYALEQAKECAEAVRAYQCLLSEIEGDDRFVETKDVIRAAIARAEMELANPFWG